MRGAAPGSEAPTGSVATDDDPDEYHQHEHRYHWIRLGAHAVDALQPFRIFPVHFGSLGSGGAGAAGRTAPRSIIRLAAWYAGCASESLQSMSSSSPGHHP